jgi:superfamily II DNA or RNA helicase
MLGKTTYDPYVMDIALSVNQDTFLVSQVLNQLQKFYNGTDTRKMVLNAFTGSGKTTVTIKRTIPDFIKEFYPQGKRVIGFICPRDEVVKGAYDKAKKSLNNKIVHGATVKVYHTDKLNEIKKNAQRTDEVENLDGDVVVICMTAQWFLRNYDLITTNGMFDLMIVDEAHIMFGTVSWEDTKADKGQWNKNFVAKTLDALSSLNSAVLFLTATPTNSQKEDTPLGAANNIYLDPMPRDVLTTPFYDVIPYIDNEDTVYEGLKYFKEQCDKVGDVIKNVTGKTWNIVKDNFVPMYPACMLRLGRVGAKNGVDFADHIEQIRKLCKQYNFTLSISTSEYGKEFDGKKIDDLATAVILGERHNHKPVVLVVVDSGYAGVDFVKLNNIIIGREPKSTIHNNYSQTGGRAARMKFGFLNHHTAGETIRDYNISDDQKRLIAEYYILHSTSVVHVPVDSKLLNIDVKQFLESDTFREFEGRKFILNLAFNNGKAPDLKDCLRLVTSTSVENNIYKQYKKDYCECCEVRAFGYTECWYNAWKAFKVLVTDKITETEMNILWKMCLQVHHKDGNHFNNDPKNLITICPNVHSLITMHNQDYNNRYPELHAALKKVAKKKGVVAPKALAFKLNW